MGHRRLLRPAGRYRRCPRRALERLERRTALGLLIVQALAPGIRPSPVAGCDAGCRGVVGPVPQPLWMNAFGEDGSTGPRPVRSTSGRGPRSVAAWVPDRTAYPAPHERRARARSRRPGRGQAGRRPLRLGVPAGAQRGGDRRPDRGDGPPQPGRARRRSSTRSWSSTTARPTPPPRWPPGRAPRVLAVDEILPDLPPGTGKGNALWMSLYACSGDIVCWLDADVRNFGSHFVTRLLAAAAHRCRDRLREGLLPPPAARRGHRRRPRHRAHGPSGDLGAVPPPRGVRAAAGG